MITAKSLATGGLGRMGNQMFAIAGCIGIAVKSGQPYAFPEWKTHDNAIFGNPVDNINDHLLNPLPNLYEKINPFEVNNVFRDYGYFWGYRDVTLPTGNWSIDSHMQSEKFFKHCLPLIRKTFTFKDEPEQNEYVAIHYRAGDYIDDPNAQHPRCSKEYYEVAMSQFPMGTKAIVFTDDFNEVYKLFKGTNFEFASKYGENNPTYVQDFKLMKRCKSFITANSSFSLMAAILGEHPEKKIVMPSRWFGSQMPAEFDTKDIYPEGAVII
jgi:Glycosyl transferase family 11